MESEIINFTPFAKVIGAVVTWGGFLLALGMFSSMISHGFSLAITEILIHLSKRSDWAGIERITRWLGNGEDVKDELREILRKIELSTKDGK